MKLTDRMKAAAAALLPKAPETVNDLRGVVADAATVSYQLTRLEAEQNEAVQAVKDTYGPRIALAKKRLTNLVKTIEAWCRTHRDAFQGRKTLLIEAHELTFRASPGKLKCTDEDAALEAILMSDTPDLIQIAVALKPALDKASIKAALESGGDHAETLAALGFTIEKPETFTFEPAHIAANDATTL